MAIINYSELQAAIANWLDRSDLAARIPEFISLAEAQMDRALRVRRMLSRSTASVDTAFAALPTGYLEAKSLAGSDGRGVWLLEAAPSEVIAAYATRGGEGKPLFYAVVGDELQVYPAPDRAYGLELTFYGKIPALSIVTPSNWLLADAPDAYLYGALLQAAPYLRDPEGVAIWSAGYSLALEGLRAGERTRVGRLRVEPELSLSSKSMSGSGI